MRRSLVVVAFAAAAWALPAAAQCNWGPTQYAALTPDGSGVVRFPANVTLCAGTYQHATATTAQVSQNTTVYVGAGQKVVIAAPTIRVIGILDASNAGDAGGAGCSGSPAGGGGADGSGTGKGGGAGAATVANGNNLGGAGGAGASYGGTGGAGGPGNALGLPGQPTGPFGSATGLADNGFGSGGGGAGCSSNINIGVNIVIPGGAGGVGGGWVELRGKQVIIPQGGSVRVNGANGVQGNIANVAQGAGGGGGAGGSVLVEATENLSIVTGGGANALRANGGNGGNGFLASSGRGNGSGGGGAGGRVKIVRPVVGNGNCPTAATSANGGNAGNVNGNGQTGRYSGTAGTDGTQTCQNGQVAPVIASLTSSSDAIDEGQSVTLTVNATDANGHLLKYDFDCAGDGTFEVTNQAANTVTCSFPESKVPGPSTFRPQARVTDWNSIALDVQQNGGGISAGQYAVGALAYGGRVAASDAQRPTITVRNVPPVATFSGPTNVNEGASGTYTLAVVDTPQDLAGRYAVVVDWGDGTSSNATNVAPPSTVNHTWADEGSYKVTVNVTDREGGVGTTSIEVTVAAVVPTVDFTTFPSSVVGDGTATTFGARVLADAPGDLAAGYDYLFTFTPPTGSPITKSVARAAGNASGVTVQQGFTTAGTWTVAVVATDRNGVASTPVTRNLTVIDPSQAGGPSVVISVTPGTTIDEGGTIALSGVLDDQVPANRTQPFAYVISWGDGTPNATGSTSSPNFLALGPINHTYADSRAAAYAVTVTVTDAANKTATATTNITVRNVAPTGALGQNPSGTEGQAVTFSATANDVSPGDRARPFTYTWTWGDGTANTVVQGALTSSAQHTYGDNGSYDVTLVITDADGGASSALSGKATIQNAPPAATVTGPSTGVEGATLRFTSTATDPSAADQAAGFTYEWDFGDGSAKESGSGAVFAARDHLFADDGPFTVTLKVTDKDGGAGTATTAVTITNAAPSVNIGDDLVLGRGESVTFDPVVTDPGAKDTFTYAWTFGDGSTSTQQKPQKSWAQQGTFTVTLRVTDNAGASATDTATVTIQNRVPVASNVVVAPAAPKSNTDLTLTFTYTDPDGDAQSGTTITWFADGQAVASLANQSTVAGSITQRGQRWYAEVTPKDGTSAGEPVRSNEVTIGNDAPAASNVKLTPAAPLRGDALTVTWDYADPDGDPQDGTEIRWTKNGQAVAALDDKTTAPAPLAKGDRWVATITPRDGFGAGQPVASAEVTVGNSPPVITELADVATAATGEQTPVTLTISATDPDGDALTYRCTRDGQEIGTGATITANFVVGTWSIECTVSDGTASVKRTVTVAVGDVPPVVSAGDDVTVDPGRPVVTAVGRDTIGRPLSYEWTVVRSAEPITLATPAAASTSFLARKAGEYELKVTVSNGQKQASDTIVVTVRNVPPTAVISPDLLPNAREDEAATVDGSLSSDANGDAITYQWAFASGPGGRFEGSSTQAVAQYVPQAPGETVLRLTVSDGELTHSATVTLRVSPETPGGNPPVARAGPDQTALVGETVQLDGSDSFDPDGAQGISYQWTQKRGPTVTIADADKVKASFVATAAGDVVLTLTVFDGTFEVSDDVTVRVVDGGGNRRPVARVAAPESAQVDDTVALDGSASSDEDGDTLTYRWSWVGGPRVTIVGDTEKTASFVALSQGIVEVELVVNDGRIDSLPVRASIAITDGANAPPVAVAKAPARAAVRTLVTLDGSESTDPEGATLTYIWTQTAGPNVSIAVPEDARSNATFSPVDAGTYGFRLVVNDGIFSSEAVEVSVEVAPNLPPVAVAKGPDAPYLYAGDRVVLDGTASSDPEGQPIAKYQWRLLDGAGSLQDDTSATPTLVPETNGEYRLQLVVRDDLGQDSPPASLVVKVNDLPVVEGGCLGSQAGPLGLAALGGLAALLRRRRSRR